MQFHKLDRARDKSFWSVRVSADICVPELDGRYLRVVTLADMVTIHNAFPDRRFRS